MSTESEKTTISPVENQSAHFSIGDWLYWTCEYTKARDHFQYILKKLSLTDSDLARCYKSLAAAEVELKQYDDAIDTYKKQLDVLQKMHESNRKAEDIMSCYLSIGRVYWLKSQYNQAIDYHYQALDYTQSSPKHISIIYKNLANIYTSAEQFDQSLKYFNKALVLDDQQQPKNYLQIGQTYANMGVMYKLQENYREALNHFERARQTLLKTVKDTHVAVENVDKAIRKISDVLALNNIMILWLDDYIGQEDNCRELKKQFRQITNSLKMFDSVESFRQCLPHVKDRKLFCIIQGKHAKEIVPDIVQITSSSSMEPVVFIFCLHMQFLNEWAQEQDCIMRGGMFDHEQDLWDTLEHHVKDYVKKKKTDKMKIPSEILDEFVKKIGQISVRCYQEKNKNIIPPPPPNVLA